MPTRTEEDENVLAMRCFEYDDEYFLRLASWIDVSSNRICRCSPSAV